MACLCVGASCTTPRNHFCTVCAKPCYTAAEADDHCDFDVTED